MKSLAKKELLYYNKIVKQKYLKRKREEKGEKMNKPANCCGCIYTRTIYFYQREELAEVAKVCLSCSKIAYDFVCKFACKIVNRARNKNKNTYYKYKKIGVV